MMPYSKLTGALLALDVRPGTFQLQLTASQTNETESGSMAPAAAAFWSGHGHLLSPPWFDMSSVLENWEDEYGQLPQEGSPELDVDLDNGKRVFVRQGVEIVLPLELFRTLISRSTAFSTGVAGTSNAALSGIRHLESEAASIPGQYTRLDTERFGNQGAVVLPLQELASWVAATAAAVELSTARQRLSWAAAASVSTAVGLSMELVERVATAHQARCAASAAAETGGLRWENPAELFFFPPPQPCTWGHHSGWKNSQGEAQVGPHVSQCTPSMLTLYPWIAVANQG
jgi:hypothetical protein